MKYYTERTSGSFIEEKSASVAWHYRLAGEEFGDRQAKALQNGLDQSVTVNYPVEVLAGKKIIEVRPVVASKGNTVRNLLARHSTASLVLCVGDDRTDEDMFKTLLDLRQDDPKCFTCKVGASKGAATTAKYGLKSVEQVVALLTRLAIASSERLSHSTI
jgi:trehalose 6-phosphate synthase/phosphatase